MASQSTAFRFLASDRARKPIAPTNDDDDEPLFSSSFGLGFSSIIPWVMEGKGELIAGDHCWAMIGLCYVPHMYIFQDNKPWLLPYGSSYFARVATSCFFVFVVIHMPFSYYVLYIK